MPVVNCKTSPFDVYIGRGSRYGNPFAIQQSGGRDAAIELFTKWVKHQPELLRLIRSELGGQRLGCHCAPLACHGDVLEKIATGAWDKHIEPEPVFVFGSNSAGRHGRGAALFAKRHRGAAYLVGQGPTGSAYAVPTKDGSLAPLPVSEILGHLDELFRYADRHRDVPFQLSRVGCGLAGNGPEQEAVIREKALEAPANVKLPGVWDQHRDPLLARVIIAGSRDFNDYQMLERKLDHLLGGLTKEGRRIECVSGGAKGADTLGERYAVERGLAFRRFPAEWERYGKQAGWVRNQLMAWYSTHLVAFWDGSSRGTGAMIKTADQDTLAVRTVVTGEALQSALNT